MILAFIPALSLTFSLWSLDCECVWIGEKCQFWLVLSKSIPSVKKLNSLPYKKKHSLGAQIFHKYVALAEVKSFRLCDDPNIPTFFGTSLIDYTQPPTRTRNSEC